MWDVFKSESHGLYGTTWTLAACYPPAPVIVLGKRGLCDGRSSQRSEARNGLKLEMVGLEPVGNERSSFKASYSGSGRFVLKPLYGK